MDRSINANLVTDDNSEVIIISSEESINSEESSQDYGTLQKKKDLCFGDKPQELTRMEKTTKLGSDKKDSVPIVEANSVHNEVENKSTQNPELLLNGRLTSLIRTVRETGEISLDVAEPDDLADLLCDPAHIGQMSGDVALKLHRQISSVFTTDELQAAGDSKRQRLPAKDSGENSKGQVGTSGRCKYKTECGKKGIVPIVEANSVNKSTQTPKFTLNEGARILLVLATDSGEIVMEHCIADDLANVLCEPAITRQLSREIAMKLHGQISSQYTTNIN